MKILSNHKIRIVITGLVLVASLWSCTSEFDEINKNQTAVSEDRFDENLLFTRSLVYGALRYTEYQRVQQLYTQHYMQYYSVSVDYFPTGRYISRNDWLTAYWNAAYSDFAMQCQQIIEITEGDELKTSKNAIARIWKAFIIHRVTDLFGDVPYNEAFSGILEPAYTAQEEIYLDMLNELKEAADILETPSIEGFGASDVVYGGDTNSWIRFANSLRLRLAMRLSEVSPDVAESHVSEVLAENNLISSNEESALLRYGRDYGFALENIQPMSILKSFGEYKISNTFVDFLRDNNDPRIAIFVEPNAEGEYIGLQNGLNPQELAERDLDTFSQDTDIISSQAAPTGLLTYPEILFLQAEAALRGWGPGSAQEFYEQGIRASIAYWENIYLDIASRIPPEEAAELPEVNISQDTIDFYLASPNIQFNEASALEQIITQKWVANLNQGLESYAEYRRTGFPNLNPIPNTDGQSETGGSELPSRLIYPAEEQALNRENYEAAVARQGPDLMTTKVWWDQ